jgi:cell division protein FtsL
MDDNKIDDVVRHRAQETREAAWANLQSVALDWIKVAACAILIVCAGYAEVISATIAINAAYPPMSDGSSPADAIMGLRYTLAFYALLGHVLISSITGRLAIGINWLLGGVGIIALFAMLFGMGLFSFAGTALTVGGDSESSGLFGLLSGMAGPALGLVCASLFVISFLVAHVLSGKLLAKLAVVSSAYAARAKVAELDREISEVDAVAAQIEAERRVIDEMEKAGALERKVVAKAACIVGKVTADAQEAVTTRKSLEGANLRDDEDAPLRDVPLSLLEQKLADLKQYTPSYFKTLLTKED